MKKGREKKGRNKGIEERRIHDGRNKELVDRRGKGKDYVS